MFRFRKIFLIVMLMLALGCAPIVATSAPPASPSTSLPPTVAPPTATVTPTDTPSPSATPLPLVPNFAHIVIVVFENKESGTVIGSPKAPYYNVLANTYTLLDQFYAVTHPSLPNYLAMISGDTFGVTSDCEDCFVNAPSLPDQIETGGRTWRTYQEDMPSPCFVGSTLLYAQKHNPFIYFDPIRLNADRCDQHIVPLDQLDADIASKSLPNFIFVTPNLCNDAHDCGIDVSDQWLFNFAHKIVPALDATGESYLVVLTWDEGQGDHSCCGLPEKAGGRIATVLISPQVKSGFKDETQYTHYSLLKTIEQAWGLPYLGHAADDNNALIVAPWK